jgi:hypothetical protein
MIRARYPIYHPSKPPFLHLFGVLVLLPSNIHLRQVIANRDDEIRRSLLDELVYYVVDC